MGVLNLRGKCEDPQMDDGLDAESGLFCFVLFWIFLIRCLDPDLSKLSR